MDWVSSFDNTTGLHDRDFEIVLQSHRVAVVLKLLREHHMFHLAITLKASQDLANLVYAVLWRVVNMPRLRCYTILRKVTS